MEILEAFDLTGTLRGAAQLAGCDHKTVAQWVRARDRAGGGLPWRRGRGRASMRSPRRSRSGSTARAGRSARTLRISGWSRWDTWVGAHNAPSGRRSEAKVARRARPTDAAVGRRAGVVDAVGLRRRSGRRGAQHGVVLRVACVVALPRLLALRDRTMASVVMALDRSLRAFGGAPPYALTDNEKTVSVDHVCGIAVRNPTIVAVGRHYGVLATCVSADPQSKGGSEATVRIAKADLVPTDHNLRDAYASFAELERACVVFCERVNTREHRITRRAPAVMLAEERERLHRLPEMPHTVCFARPGGCRGSQRSRSAARFTRSRRRSLTNGCGRARMVASSSSFTPTAATGRTRSPGTR
jgi:hypothetical protein